MRFLLSNDDGIDAPGIRALALAMARVGDVYICAPDGERSANSHHLNMRTPLIARQVDVPGAKAAWAVSGTPADCVKLGLSTLVDGADMVVAGINQGANLGSDCIYSGTVAAAQEGNIMGLPAIASSLDSFTSTDFSLAAAVTARLAVLWMEQGHNAPHTTLNINVPAGSIQGIRLATIGSFIRPYIDKYEPEPLADGTVAYHYCGTLADIPRHGLEEDDAAVAAGYIALTPLTYNLVHTPGLFALGQNAGQSKLDNLLALAQADLAL